MPRGEREEQLLVSLSVQGWESHSPNAMSVTSASPRGPQLFGSDTPGWHREPCEAACQRKAVRGADLMTQRSLWLLALGREQSSHPLLEMIFPAACCLHSLGNGMLPVLQHSTPLMDIDASEERCPPDIVFLN